jgi:hypothetical protein
MPSAWFSSDRNSFLSQSVRTIVGDLASRAAQEGLHIEPEQHEEWHSSVGILQVELADRLHTLELLQESLSSPALAAFHHVILEYDLRRRGLRIDCVLLGEGIIAVIEFKRTTIVPADREQVTNYCINLVEFHEETRRLVEDDKYILVPIVAQTFGKAKRVKTGSTSFHRSPWDAVSREPLECDRETLHLALEAALGLRRSSSDVDPQRWLHSRFSPSSNILDAAISLYGSHDVSGISSHAAPVELIEKCTEEVAKLIEQSQQDGTSRIIFVSGAPGAGKTLVGLKLTFDPRFREDAVFVTGNAPLVEVLTKALKDAYRRKHRRSAATLPSGYAREEAQRVIEMATFKIVKAHVFLGHRGSDTRATDGRIVVFDEAQRTYEKGKEVLRRRLEADEAEMIMTSLTRSYGEGGKGCVVVALVGHNQAINRGEMGIAAWFSAAEKLGWRFSISDETLALSEINGESGLASHHLRDRLENGHLPHSLRYYRNSNVERWAELVLNNKPNDASNVASELTRSDDTIWMTRELAVAKAWAREQRVGDERVGLIASGQARRLAAEGLFVDLKPSIADWMLAPSGDIRSSNMLETVQNQYQVQGLELDYTIVCWDLDLRRVSDAWSAHKISGATWKEDKALDIAKNSYRVLLTRARKGMMIFVPRGSTDNSDPTRSGTAYDEIAAYLVECGVRVPNWS